MKKKLEITDTSRGLFPEQKSSEVSEIEDVFNAHRNICIWRHKVEKFKRKINETKVEKFQKKIDETRSEFNSKKVANFSFLKIKFPRDITGYIYADYILNGNDPITESQALGTTVLFKELNCYFNFSRGIDEFPLIYVAVSLENLQKPSFHFKKEIVYKIEISHLFINWISEKENDKKGFANCSYNSPLLGQALIFNDDNIREDVNSAIENTLQKIKQKYGYAPSPLYWTEEQISLARGETALHYVQEL